MYATPRERAASALAAFAVVLLIAFTLVFGLRVAVAVRAQTSLVSIFLEPPKPPEPKQPKPHVQPRQSSAAKGAPAPRNLKNKATPVVAPPPPLPPLIVPPPIVVATQAGTGQAAQTGASDRPGPGQGAGGLGNGLGGGGNGGDGNGGVAVGPRQIHGHLSFDDLPEGLLAAGREATVGVRYHVEVDGHVSDCRIDEPSGISPLDALTCRLIEERFRFKPARDAFRQPVRATIVESHTWIVEPEKQGG